MVRGWYLFELNVNDQIWSAADIGFLLSESPEKNLADLSSEGGLVLFWKYGVSFIYLRNDQSSKFYKCNNKYNNN